MMDKPDGQFMMDAFQTILAGMAGGRKNNKTCYEVKLGSETFWVGFKDMNLAVGKKANGRDRQEPVVI
jgi:hypothetical protein